MKKKNVRQTYRYLFYLSFTIDSVEMCYMEISCSSKLKTNKNVHNWLLN